MTGRGTRISLAVWSVLVIAFLWIPLAIIALYAFNGSTIQGWPITSWTTHWFSVAWHDPDVRSAFELSVKVGVIAALVALVLGTMAAAAVARYRFFGREAVSFLLILPLALPGIITGLALRTSYTTVGIDFGLLTIIIGHATFCIVVVYNNSLARLRRVSGSLEQASYDLGADAWQTFRYVTFPQMRTALLAGGLLAFALSWDEVVVTIFTAGAQQTLPIWIFANLFRPIEQPVVNVVALFVIVLSLIPVWIAQRVTAERPGVVRGAGAR